MVGHQLQRRLKHLQCFASRGGIAALALQIGDMDLEAGNSLRGISNVLIRLREIAPLQLLRLVHLSISNFGKAMRSERL